jgi:hypothetical protein
LEAKTEMLPEKSGNDAAIEAAVSEKEDDSKQ